MMPWSEQPVLYQVVIYPIASHLWRWEIRSGRGALLRCGTSYTEAAAEVEARAELDA